MVGTTPLTGRCCTSTLEVAVAHSIGGRDGVTEVWAHGTVLQPEPSSASEARDFVCLQLIEHKLLHLVEDIRLVASEFATIAMVYTRAPFTLRLEAIKELFARAVLEGSPPPPLRAPATLIDP